MAKGEVRDRMVAGALQLLATAGPPGASFGDVLALTGAPRGSIYHHFPGGRKELHRDALELAGAQSFAALDSLRGKKADVVVQSFFGMWRELLTGSQFAAGCAVLAVAVAAEEPETKAHTGEIFRAWREQIEELLVEGGLGRSAARSVAALTIAATEGAVVVARAEGDLEAFDLISRQVVTAVRAELRRRPKAAAKAEGEDR